MDLFDDMFHAMRRYSAPFHKKRSMQAIRSENERFLRRLKQSSLSSFPSQEDSRSRSYGYPSHHRHRHWHNSSYSSHFSEQNHTITTSVSLRVTPLYDHFTSWGILWAAGFCIAVFAALQVFQEYRPLAKQQRLAAPTNNTDNYNSSGNLTDVTGGGDPTPPTPVSRRRYQTAPSDALTSVQPLSSANMTRFMFRRLLLLSILARLISIPVEIWSDPLWWQFVGDTLPEMIFASAWSLLVTFFVQIVGIFDGTGTNTSPGIVISVTACVIYLVLIAMQLFNKIATVLLYALLCCIYATLLGVVVYFCPRLASLLQSSLSPHRGLATRVLISSTLCVFIFTGHIVHYARLVVAPPRKVYWWWQYGVLELIPSLIFLIVLQPNANKGNRNLETASPAPDINSRRRRTDGIQRVDSDIHRLDDNVNATVIAAASSGNSSNQRQESTHLLKEVGFAQQGYESTLLYNVTTK